MKAPRCKLDGLFMRYVGRWALGRSTVPWGWFVCAHGHRGALVLPWAWEMS